MGFGTYNDHMIKRIQILILTVWLSFNSMAQPTSSFKVFSQPDRMSEVIDKIPLQKKLKKVRESSDGRWIKITYLDQYKNPVSGWIEKKSVESDVEDVDAPNPWSFGFGLVC